MASGFVDKDLVRETRVLLDANWNVRVIMDKAKKRLVNSGKVNVNWELGGDFGPVKSVEVRGGKGFPVNGMAAQDPDSINSVTDVGTF